MNNVQFLQFFLQAAPYIHAHRNKTFVLYFDGDINAAPLKKFLHECAILHSLGVHLVLVHGARHQIDVHLQRAGLASQFHRNKRITSKAMMPEILDAVGSLRLRIEATLSMGMINSPMQGAALRVASGNFIIAKPVGVIDGQDFGFAGEIRRINAQAISHHLQLGEIVLISPLGYSPTGYIYNLSAEDIASQVAINIHADKLIYVSDGVEHYKLSEQLRQLTPAQARTFNGEQWMNQRLNAAAHACEQGIKRVHLIDRDREGALLCELFTRDGVGIMVTSDHYDHLRRAQIDDIGGLLDLIRPLELQGILVKRSREHLENEIQHFYVLERDGTIIGCAALFPYPEEKMAELACVVIHPDYRQNQRADNLMQTLECKAREQNIEKLFILTTHTAQWFEERGFQPANLDELPSVKKQAYNYQRNSRTYIKTLHPDS